MTGRCNPPFWFSGCPAPGEGVEVALWLGGLWVATMLLLWLVDWLEP